MEVFLNFPVGMAIQRLLKRSGQFSARERNKLDRYFGTSEWYDLLNEQRHDMFDSDSIRRAEQDRGKNSGGRAEAGRETRSVSQCPKGLPLCR